jgi:hypothetical protein
MTAQPKTRVRRATIHLPASEVMPVTIRGYGFRAVCDCGWESKAERSYALARKNLRAHKFWHAQGEPLSLAGPV